MKEGVDLGLALQRNSNKAEATAMCSGLPGICKYTGG